MTVECSVAGCDAIATRVAAGLCEMHYYRLRRHGDTGTVKKVQKYFTKTCSVADCSRPLRTKGYCNMHYLRLWRKIDIGTSSPLINNDGDGHISQEGYKFKTENGHRMREHRRIVEEILDKPLPKGSVIHHLNGDRQDNRTCNLVVCPNEAYHQELHFRQKLSGYKGPEHTEEYKARQAKGAALTLENLFSKV